MLRPVALGFLVSAALVSSPAAAQVPYTITHGTAVYSAFTGGTPHAPVAYGVFPALDEGAVEIPLPFTFTWYGVPYTSIWAYTNGFLSFSAPNTMGILGPPRVVPSPLNTVHDYIGPYWADFVVGPNGSIQSRSSGSAGSRVVQIQYAGFERNGAPAGSTGVSFQVRLYEGTGLVEVAYGPSFGVVSATSAMENSDGSQGDNLMAASATCLGSCVCSPRQCSSINFGGMGGRTIRIELPNQAEVQGTLQVPPGAFSGDTFNADYRVLNAGLADAGAFSYEFLLTASNTSTAGATVLSQTTLPAGLTAQNAIVDTVALTVPAQTPVGDYYIALVTDSGHQIVEVSETNNVAYSTVFRTGPELTGSVTAPAETGPGENFDVQLNLRSDGAPVVTAVAVQFYLSPTAAVDGNSVMVGPPRLVTLPDGFAVTQTLTLTAPAGLLPSPPNYYVVAVIDHANAIVETDETNNTVASMSTVDVRGADIDVRALDGGAFGFRGEPYPMSTVISNAGAATARDFTVCVLLSDNLLISLVSDVRLLETGLITLAPGETQTLGLQPVIPAGLAVGPWYVAVIADCTTVVPEALETNNTRRRADVITVMDPSPDFIPVTVSTASSAAAGETLPIAATIGNVGNASGTAHVRFVLSDNPGITILDTAIYDTQMPVSIAPTDEVAVSAWVALQGDLPTGNYYVGAIVDPLDETAEVLEGNNVLGAGPFVVAGADLAIVSPTMPHPVIGNPYAWRFAAAGGSGGYVWTATWDGDRVPNGLTFDAAGAELAGTPTADGEGSYALTIRVTSGNLNVEARYNLLVAPPTLPLTVVTSRLPPAVATQPYSVQLVAVGGVPPYLWALGSPGPAGISVGTDGQLGGEPQLVGPSIFTVVVRDQIGQRASGRLSLDIVDPTASITIATADVPSGLVNEVYQTGFNTVGGTPPLTWTLEGNVAPGLQFEPATAQLTGTPTVAGDYEIVVEVRDSMGLLDRNGYILEVYEEGVLRIITGTDDDTRLPDGEDGQPYLTKDGEPARLVANPPEGVRWMLVNGTLPSGLGLEANTGVISGTASEAGNYAFTVLAINEANDFRRRSLVIHIETAGGDQPPIIESEGCRCVNASTPANTLGLLFGLGLVLTARRRRLR